MMEFMEVITIAVDVYLGVLLIGVMALVIVLGADLFRY